jgi:hypothetical protein
MSTTSAIVRISLAAAFLASLLPLSFIPAASAQDAGGTVSCTYVYDGGPDGVKTGGSAQLFPSIADCETQAKNQEASALGQPAGDRKRCTCSKPKSEDISPTSMLNNAAFKPLGDTSVQGIIGNIIKYVLGMTGVIALVMFIYGGFLWMTAAGSSDNVEKAKNILVWATLGIIAIFGAYALVDVVFKAVG